MFVCSIRRELIPAVMLNHDIPSYIEVHLLKRSIERPYIDPDNMRPTQTSSTFKTAHLSQY